MGGVKTGMSFSGGVVQDIFPDSDGCLIRYLLAGGHMEIRRHKLSRVLASLPEESKDVQQCSSASNESDPPLAFCHSCKLGPCSDFGQYGLKFERVFIEFRLPLQWACML